MYNLPLGKMTEDWGSKIGSSVGVVHDVEVGADGIGWGNFIRARVELKLQKALARGRFIEVQGKKVWIDFKYEKLPDFVLHVDGCCMVAKGVQWDLLQMVHLSLELG